MATKTVKVKVKRLSADTIRTLRWIEKQILEEPKRFNMDLVTEQHPFEAVRNDDDLPQCGTVACIAGWYAIKKSGKLVNERLLIWDENSSRYKAEKFKLWIYALPPGFRGDEMDYAQKKMGLTDGEASALFHTDSWPDSFRNSYNNAQCSGNRKMLARIAARRIEHFIKTRE